MAYFAAEPRGSCGERSQLQRTTEQTREKEPFPSNSALDDLRPQTAAIATNGSHLKLGPHEAPLADLEG